MSESGSVAEVSRYFYGSDPSQFADLYVPVGTRRSGIVVLFHGGWWGPKYGSDNLDGMANDLAGRGWVVWNVEYRRLGLGGGYPATLEDAASAIDFLAGLVDDVGVDAGRVVAIGHSAGGHLAVWAAGRGKLRVGAPGAGPRVELAGVISLAGVLDVRAASREGLGQGAATQFVGAGSEDEAELRYAVADPMGQLPIPAVVSCVHAPGDDRVPFSQAVGYVRAARAAGQDARLLEVEGDHFSVADPAAPSWPSVVSALEALTTVP